MAAVTLPCPTTRLPPSSSQPRFLLLRSPPRSRASGLHHRPHLLPIHFHPLVSISARCSSSSSSYNGWADLPADLDFPFPLCLPESIAAAPQGLLLLLLPVAVLSISRLPPLPLLAAAFTAGFATARRLAPSSQSQPHHDRLAALLADLGARLRAFRDGQLSSPDDDAGGRLLFEAVDRTRDAVLEYAATLAGQGGSGDVSSTAASGEALSEVAREVAGYFGGWARDTLRELSFASPRKKPKEIIKAAAAVGAKNDSDAGLVHSGDKDAEGKTLDSAVARAENASSLNMLSFDDEDASGLKDAEFSGQNTQEDDRLERLVSKHRYGRGGVRNDDPFEGGGRFATESTESSLLERTLEIRDRSYRFKIERRNGESRRVSEAQERRSDSFVGNAASVDDPMDDEVTGTGADDEEFSRNVREAAEILKKARECMMARADEETADALLYKSASLLSTAVALRPTSLVAVGQLGNTYLLHGELKLKISRELRTLLANSGSYLNGRERVSRSRKLDRRILSRDNISSALVGVCEECEGLLVEAGRSYRTAVSIDSDDVKALYNWGLALIFRGQLLADIGPEAAVDADRVYLAAIDKFDAMLSKSNTYAPEALYRWGSALQQRSQLRSRSNKEKIRLLEQAKSLFEDVLYVEADNKMVREALSSCISELNYHGRWI